ncbi:CPBP family intramembrane glutamic endopeptidase [Pseudonocardia sp. HH130630-07]|uniref:CPBP family intramembrane glutamic endopeptidase n=1 Tax=Pseudonocardia sp. HH130630-07 TaxID=1690815 RepID=UPI000814F266|nr:type II CAAX endopeptidase family protein [Pseudonocardia sp. HH130630-07]ANY06153.1 hypothetical protein AFB00_07410 [Pseudonocardia sp. HH130630-07]
MSTVSRVGDTTTERPRGGGRPLKVWQFLVLTALYLVIVQGAIVLLRDGTVDGYGEPTSIDYLVRALVIPTGLVTVFALGVATYLGAWSEMFVNRRPLRRWVIAVPLAVLVLVAVVTNYSGLAAKGLTFALLLLVATLMVGFAEELMFRGVGVVVFRSNGYSEVRVGLWTTLVFGLAHGTNVITSGSAAFLQVVLTSATGFVFYLVLRSTGALAGAMLAHGLWDFGVLSTQVDPADPSPMANVAGAGLAVILLVVLVLGRQLRVRRTEAERAPG